MPHPTVPNASQPANEGSSGKCKIVSYNDRMPVALYHGTSKLFLQSIQSAGLGAKDPNVTFRTRELLHELAEAREWNWYEDPYLVSVRYIVDERVTSGGFNFRYDGTYLSPSKTTAVRYALNNRFGSELLSTAFGMFERLKTYDQRRACEIIEGYPELLWVDKMPSQPLLVEALDVPIRNLCSEDGEDPTDALNMLTENVDDANGLIWQQTNFELTSPLPASNLKYYCIEHRNADPILPDYSLKVLDLSD